MVTTQVKRGVWLGAVTALALVAVAGWVVLDGNRAATYAPSDGAAPLPLASGGPATDAACSRLTERLPDRLGDNRRLTVKVDAGRTAAWGNPPIVLQCGVALSGPATAPGAALVNVNGVAWHQQVRKDDVVWTTPRTLIPVALLVPQSYDGHGGFLALLAPAVKAMQTG